MKTKNKGLWKGLTSLFAFVLAFAMVVGMILEANAGTIDTYIGTQSSKFESVDNPDDP